MSPGASFCTPAAINLDVALFNSYFAESCFTISVDTRTVLESIPESPVKLSIRKPENGGLVPAIAGT